MDFLTKINEFQQKKTLTKHEHIVLGTIESIQEGIIEKNDRMPSINKMISNSGYSRKTIFDAYEELKKRGLIESKMGKGYYVTSCKTNIILKVALMLFNFQRFQQEFYDAFRSELGEKYQIDVFFHHNTKSVFESIAESIKHKYGFYVIAPIQEKSIIQNLQTFDPQKLLIIDRYIPIGQEYSFIAQEFEDSVYSKLIELIPDIKKYEEFVLLFKPNSMLPTEVIQAFQRFISKYEINGKIAENYDKNLMKQNTVYFCVDDNSLWEVLRDADNEGLSIGKDVGVLSIDDHIVKEMIHGGITTISSDFKEMGRKAAQHVQEGELRREFISLSLIKRNSV